ncbi:class F sortase [Salimicrobium sp. PL1-032A]|uniref:class F sortase n=1 Tax=Salimicrobium sp. PL1-032A TaxID=3095364 RepID=UPI0032614316
MLGIASLLLIIGGVVLILSSMDKERAESTSSGNSEVATSSGIQLKKEFSPSSDEKAESTSPTPGSPEHIRIPSIGVDAPIIATGLDENNEMVVPDNGEEVAWFEPGREPGEEGNAVLAGHVDDYSGPAVFFDLEKLQPGDEITITDERDMAWTFIVDKVEAYPLGEAPIRDIFGPEQGRKMNLLTCTGLYDASAGTHEERLAVYTTMKQE